MVDLFFKEPKDYLRFEFELRKSRRPAYSMRAFARDINMSPSGLSDFMNDRVGMSEARVAEIADKLQWPLVRREHFNDLILSKGKFSSSDRKAALLRVRSRVQEQENILSEV
jgi:hypothetical protein